MTGMSSAGGLLHAYLSSFPPGFADIWLIFRFGKLSEPVAVVVTALFDLAVYPLLHSREVRRWRDLL